MTTTDVNGGPGERSHELAEERVRAVVSLDFDTLYKDYKRKVYGTVSHIVGRTDELDDIVQTVFLEIYRSLGRYKGNSQLSTWIYRIAVNVSLQYIRKRKRRRVFLFFKGDEAYERIGRDVRSQHEHREVLEKLYQQLEKLSEKKRIVFVLHELEGRSPEQIAAICDIPPNTVRSRLHAARTELVQRMRRAGLLEKRS
jgi:RNA polymerase sigma-70 factor (ECF subfamily)